MVRIEEITSMVSSLIDKFFGPATVWPRIAEDVRKTSLTIANMVHSFYESSINTIFTQDKKTDISVTSKQTLNAPQCHHSHIVELNPAHTPDSSKENEPAADVPVTPHTETLKSMTATPQANDTQPLSSATSVTKPQVRKTRSKKETSAAPKPTKPRQPRKPKET